MTALSSFTRAVEYQYDSYIGAVYELLEREASEASICDYLRNFEVGRMEMVDVC